MTRAGEGDHRRATRHKTFLVGSLAGADRVVRCHVLNISTTGALVHCAAGFDAGTRVTLQSDDFAIRSLVAWNGGERCGLTFAVPATPYVIARLIH